MRSSIIVAALAAFLPLAVQAQDVPEGNVQNGQRLFNQCRACHTINEGGRNGVGPNLHGVIGRQMASVQGFNYSPPFREHAGAHGPWTEENLRPYLDNPQAVVPGTRMAYPGFRGNQQNISDVIAYLKTQSGS